MSLILPVSDCKQVNIKAQYPALTRPSTSSIRTKLLSAALSSQLQDSLTHHNLYLKVADLQIMLVVDIHSFKGTTYSLMSSHQKNYGKSSCKWEKEKN